MADSPVDVEAISFVGVAVGETISDGWGLSTHPTYDVSLGDPPRSFTLAVRLVSFRDLQLATRGEVAVASAFPARMSKWKRYITLSPSDLTKIASQLDGWMRELFMLRPKWSRLVVDAMHTFCRSAVLPSRPSAHGTLAGPLPPPPAKPGQGSDDRTFGVFLSHYKFECGTEARLLHLQLPRLLPNYQNIFLDSGKQPRAPPLHPPE